MNDRNRTIKVTALARVEGEGGLHLKIGDGRVLEAKFNIFEPPRFFEALLRGRRFYEAPDITARICGICPVAYQMSAVHALESALAVSLDEPMRVLRRLIYCGEWIESHSLHVTLLHAPDFLGYPDALKMAQDYPEQVRLGLELKKAGNALVRLIGGRSVHPINVKVGGLYRFPQKHELNGLSEQLKRARDIALDMIRWVSTFSFPDFEQDYEFVALRHSRDYPYNEGRLVSNKGLDIAVADYESVFQERHVAHSTALQSTHTERGTYLVGPLARYTLNFDRLRPVAQEAALAAGLGKTCRNPFQSIVVRSVEILNACDEALAIIGAYHMPEPPGAEVFPRSAVGCAVTEAPRGILYHRYSIDEDGIIVDANIVPPTSQNQQAVENDLHYLAAQNLQLPTTELTLLCEQAIRNYDPCISCSTHLL